MSKRTLIALIILGVFIGFALIRGASNNEPASEAAPAQREVQTAPAGLIGQLDAVLGSTGEIKSQTQGDLRTQSAGVITQVHKRVGDNVAAGTIVASVENASERASVAQAQAGVEQAQANLNKVSGGTRDEQLAVLAATTLSARQAIDEAYISALNALLSAYATTDSTFIGGVDAMFNDADGANPELLFSTTESTGALAAEHGRFILQDTIDRHESVAQQIRYYDNGRIRLELERLEDDMLEMKTVLDALITALDGAVANSSITSVTISAYKTTAATARANILSTLATLSSTRATLNSTQAALTVAQENEEQGVTGAQQEDVDVARAQLSAAQATLAQTVAQLEKTRVRAPVTGVITILNVEVGDFVTSFQDVGLVANEQALEVQTFIAPSMLDRITVNDEVRINDAYAGVITSIAPGIDPQTRQVEVRVALIDDAVNIPHGSRVHVDFLSQNSTEIQADSQLLIPISALKLIGNQAQVFVVTEEGTLAPLEVELGEVVQSSVEILSGINHATVIVLDARGLNQGDAVIIAN